MSFSHVKSITKRFNKISEVIGRKIKPKDMRTSSCSHLSNEGGYNHAAKIAGHTNPNTTKKFYIKSSIECGGEEEKVGEITEAVKHCTSEELVKVKEYILTQEKSLAL